MDEVSAIVVMGVSGVGKSTVAALIAQRLGWKLAEADQFHSQRNVDRMRSGIPLTDEDRWPWLDAIAEHIARQRASKQPCVVACSALKRAYRERLRGGHDDVRFVHLVGDFDTIAARMSDRTGHYMPLSLLQSQFDTLEPPGSDEIPVVILVDRAPPEIVALALSSLGLTTT